MELKIIEDEDYEAPKWSPRKASFRTPSQWLQFILYKIGFYKEYGYSYACPVCGEDHDHDYPSSTMINMSTPQYNSYYSYEFGVTGYDWHEEHQCNNCGTVYGFSNSNC